MSDETTQYFLVYGDASEPGARPVGLARYIRDAHGKVLHQETVRRDLTWHQTDVFLREARGELDWDLAEVDEAEAHAYVERLRARSNR